MRSISANYSQHGAEGVYRVERDCLSRGRGLGQQQATICIPLHTPGLSCLSASQSLTLSVSVNGSELFALPHCQSLLSDH